ncbi:MAG: homocysteine S-methyltransferase family protein [Atopobiaceae bacterium]|nr:homocysteine S-methyltransferase family protein [Atopobiaceae bacterium]
MRTSVTIHAPEGHLQKRCVRVADEHLAAVLAGKERLLFDGGMGTMLQEAGLAAGECPELLCLTKPQQITAVHEAYVAAGSEVVTTNTFGANATKLAEAARAQGIVRVPTVTQVFEAAVACARAARPRYVAADIGPTGALLRPLGTLSFDDAYDLFAEEVRAADAAGADIIIIETMADLLEAKAAVLAAKESSDLPIFCTMTFGEDGRTFLGTTPEVAAVTLGALGVDVLGINCSLGPADLAPLIERMIAWSRCPVMVQANAGLPSVVDGRTTYDIDAAAYCAAVAPMLDAGVTVVGGCCGTTPDYIAGERALLAELPGDGALPDDSALQGDGGASASKPFAVTSAQQLVSLRASEVGVIGERINPTGKKRLKEALRTKNYDYIYGEAISQERAGAQILDVNAGLPEIDEAATLVRLVEDLQGVTTLPLQIDSADPLAIEAAVRIYPGKPIINSTNGKREVLEAVLPIAAHYGCAIVGLALDEDGIPPTAEGRLCVARRIVEACDEWGIPREDVLIDCLTMAVSTDQRAARAILDAVRLVKAELPGVRCVLGVSNISFGLPFRELLNATFLTAAFEAGLDLAIMNPLSQRFMDAVAAWRVFNGEDKNAAEYIANNAGRSDAGAGAAGVRGAAGAPGGAGAGGAAGAGSTPAAAGADGSVSAGSAAGLAGASETIGAAGAGNVGGAGVAGAVGGTTLPGTSGATLEGRVRESVLEGRGDPVAEAVRALLREGREPLALVNEVLIPALDEVGERFEKGTFFLPQLMASAEAAKAGFNTIREAASADDVPTKGEVALCTVKGDIHDIGKNIVKMLLENYGYRVHDLGRDVDPQAFVDEVVSSHIELAGLSALMTTTVPAMAETIALLRDQAPWCKVMVGGAVLNQEYAQMVGADFYAKDASESARIAAEVLG